LPEGHAILAVSFWQEFLFVRPLRVQLTSINLFRPRTVGYLSKIATTPPITVARNTIETNAVQNTLKRISGNRRLPTDKTAPTANTRLQFNSTIMKKTHGHHIHSSFMANTITTLARHPDVRYSLVRKRYSGNSRLEESAYSPHVRFFEFLLMLVRSAIK
jgi:hypothetical protein